MTRRGILTGGTWCVDRNLLVDQWPAENGRADILHSDMSGGGSACNLAIAIKKLDPALPVATVGLVGDDLDGRFLISHADTHRIDHARMAMTDGAATDYTLAFSSAATGQRTHISYFGVSHLLTPEHFDFTGSAHRLFHLGLPGVHQRMDNAWRDEANGWVATLKKARAAGLQTNLELASIEPRRLAEIVRPCLPYLDLLVINDAEVGGLAEIATVAGHRTDTAACAAAAKAVLALGAMQLVAVHFPLGALVVTRDGHTIARPSVRVPADAIAGANGAGDAFAAGFVYGFHQGWGIDAALSLAHAAAAASLRQISTTGAVEPWQECLKLAAKWGWREDFH
ncbi:MAG: carbohydrate kinase family protein [Gammaproteobacteria bacterium]